VLRAAAAALVAVAAVVLVRFALDDRPPGRSAAPTPAPAPASSASAAVPRPPYDTGPGRTPIPAPTQIGDQLSGVMPDLGGPDRAAARRAADLVLGRYCADPARYTFSLDGGPDWRQVRIFLVELDRSGGPVQQWRLVWTGRTYQWIAPVTLAAGC
jgi:hypothetical protein